MVMRSVVVSFVSMCPALDEIDARRPGDSETEQGKSSEQ
jgi:hypothetical protein